MNHAVNRVHDSVTAVCSTSSMIVCSNGDNEAVLGHSFLSRASGSKGATSGYEPLGAEYVIEVVRFCRIIRNSACHPRKGVIRAFFNLGSFHIPERIAVPPDVMLLRGEWGT